MSLHRDRQIPFERKLKLIAGAGVPIPKEVTELQERLAQFVRGPERTAARDALARAVIDGTTDTAPLWSAAVAETLSHPAVISDVVGPVRQRVNSEIRATYQRHSAEVYAAIATKFDAAAAALHETVTLVDPDADPVTVLDLPPKAQKAWKEAKEVHAAALHRLLRPLVAAAELAGLIDCDSDENQLALVARLDGVDPGDAFDAWTIEQRQELAERQAQANQPFTTYEQVRRSRCGRWTALIKAGATLRAATDDFQPFEKPKPPLPNTVPPVRERIVSPRIRVKT